jgi:hypothetical protein
MPGRTSPYAALCHIITPLRNPQPDGDSRHRLKRRLIEPVAVRSVEGAAGVSVMADSAGTSMGRSAT